MDGVDKKFSCAAGICQRGYQFFGFQFELVAFRSCRVTGAFGVGSWELGHQVRFFVVFSEDGTFASRFSRRLGHRGCKQTREQMFVVSKGLDN